MTTLFTWGNVLAADRCHNEFADTEFYLEPKIAISECGQVAIGLGGVSRSKEEMTRLVRCLAIYMKIRNMPDAGEVFLKLRNSLVDIISHIIGNEDQVHILTREKDATYTYIYEGGTLSSPFRPDGNVYGTGIPYYRRLVRDQLKEGICDPVSLIKQISRMDPQTSTEYDIIYSADLKTLVKLEEKEAIKKLKSGDF